MNRPRRSKSPFQSLRSLFSRAFARESVPARLAARAGEAGAPAMEQLETRQYLFSITIGPDDINPFTGYGTIQAYFAYILPYLSPAEAVQIQDDENRPEDFNNDDPVVPGQNGTPIPSGATFAASFLRVFHNLTSLTLERETPGENTPPNLVRAGIDPGQRLSFKVAAENNPNIFLGMKSFSAFIGRAGATGPGGFMNTDNTTVTLLLQGKELASYTGADLAALTSNGDGTGTLTLTTGDPDNATFDEVRIEGTPGNISQTFTIDDLLMVINAGNYVGLLNGRVFGTQLTFTGPVGASVEVLDLYGRQMQQTLAVGQAAGNSNFVFVDPEDNGVPNFNDGIGRINITGGDAKTALTIFGGEVAPLQGNNQNIEFIQDGFSFALPDSMLGIYDEFEGAGFGFGFNNQGDTIGLPPGPGSVLIGSPFVRNNTNGGTYNPGGNAVGQIPVVSGFNRADQGIFSDKSIGSLYIHGMLMGASNLKGAVDRFWVGSLLGSVSIAGDVGQFLVASDAGGWEADPDNPQPPFAGPFRRVNNQLTIGRTAGEILIGGRSLLNVTVVGNINDQLKHPARDVLRYFEREVVQGIDPTTNDGERVTMRLIINSNDALSINPILNSVPFLRNDQTPMWGEDAFRNDNLMHAEYVGNIGTAIQIAGDVGLRDPLNTGEDPADVYAFASNGTSQIVIEVDSNPPLNVYARIVDSDGRTVAAADRPQPLQALQSIRYTPDAPGIYYLVISQAVDGNFNTGTAYVATIGGMASTTLGAYRTGASNGSNDINQNGGVGNSLSVLSGSIGSLRIGTGIMSGAGVETDPNVIYNDDEPDVDVRLDWLSSFISTPGSIYDITAGSDIRGTLVDPVQIIVSGDVGHFTTGLAPVVGLAPTEGDVGPMSLRVGKRIAFVDVKGAIGIDQDAPDPVNTFFGPDSANFVTGIKGGNGDIGMFRVGGHVAGGHLVIDTSPGSTIGSFLVSQDIQFEPGDARIGIYDANGLFGVKMSMGSGSDVRFASIPRIDLSNSQDASIPIIVGQPVELVDDGGGTVRIEITGANSGLTLGRIRTLAVDGSQGVIISDIDADLTGGAVLTITGTGQPNSADVISIGRINITGAGPGSGVKVTGTTEIDVRLIEQTFGEPLTEIANETPSGDLVAVDVQALDRLLIGPLGGGGEGGAAESGDLGRTQVVPWGPRLIGPFLGVQRGASQTVGDAIGIVGPMDNDWNGNLYRAPNNVNVNAGQALLDDIGSPVDPYLNGLIVRANAITLVSVGGAVGDVITQGGNITSLIANSDAVTPLGRFDGIVGNVYASADVVSVDIGDGVQNRTSNPLSSTGIFAGDDVISVFGSRIAGANISSSIISGNNIITVGQANGIGSIALSGGGDIVDAWIAARNLDDFWGSYFYGDDNATRGDLAAITGTGADIFHSQISVNDVANITLTGGAWDATRLDSTGRITLVSADSFRNSTRAGTDLEFHENRIEGAENLVTLITTGLAGDMSDLEVDILGSVTTQIGARNFNRLSLDVDNTITLLTATNDMRASRVSAGQLLAANAGRSIRTSEFAISGAITTISAADSIAGTRISVTGPAGHIDSITAAKLIEGTISASGPIASIVCSTGDIIATINTTTTKGSVGTVQAGRDLDIRTDISAGVNALIAGRHIGNIKTPGVIVVRGDLATLDAHNGQLYSDVRIGQQLTGIASIGRVVHKPGQSALGKGSIYAFGRINDVEILGDFRGGITSYSGGIGTVRIQLGSLLPAGNIKALDGDIGKVIVNSGNVYGSIYADYILGLVRVQPSADGVFGDIGINPAFNPGTPYDQFRNAIPPGLVPDSTVQGAHISAGRNLGRVEVLGGSVFESFFQAGRAIGTIQVKESIRNDTLTTGIGSVIAAGSNIFTVDVAGELRNTHVISGVKSFGADNKPGGNGDNADSLNVGRIQFVKVGTNAANDKITVGMTAGADGIYNTADDKVIIGNSFIRVIDINGSVNNVTAYSDKGVIEQNTPGVIVSGTKLPGADPDLYQGGPKGVQLAQGDNVFTLAGGQGKVTLNFSGPGSAFFDVATKQVVLIKTTVGSNLTVSATAASLSDFDIVSNDDASMGTIKVNPNLIGDSDIVVDGYILNLNLSNFAGTGDIRVGNNIQTLSTKNFTGGFITALHVRDLIINGDFGSRTQTGEAFVHFVANRDTLVTGNFSGQMNVERDLFGPAGFTVTGKMDRGTLRVGSNLSTFKAGSVSESRFSVRDSVGPVVVLGGVFDTSFMIGGDLGADTVPGGTGLNADQATSGFASTFTIGGGFAASDIVAGMLRGPDGFFGTSDDSLADGRSAVGAVTIGINKVGSNLNSEQYRIASTGTLGPVTIAGSPAKNQGNFKVLAIPTDPLAIRVTDLQVGADGGIWFARIFFNQPMDASSFAGALTISEVRADGNVIIKLKPGIDYTIQDYDAVNNAMVIMFSTNITNRNLPQQPGVAGPGVYRFQLNQAKLRAAIVNARLDGDNDGFAQNGDSYSQDDIVGDAGDKFVNQTDDLPGGGKVDFYAPVDLNLVFDSNKNPDNLPDANRLFTLRGAIGDHPDHDASEFRFAGDVDLYRITLQAGQILRLGAMQGNAIFADRRLLDADGNTLFLTSQGLLQSGGNNDFAIRLPNATPEFNDLSVEDTILIKQTGVYFIAVANTTAYTDPDEIPNPDSANGTVGDYAFTVQVFDDGDSGFAGDSDAGDGTPVVNAPPPINFAGPDGNLKTLGDNLKSITIGDFVFTLGPGKDGQVGTLDDIVSGTNGKGVTSTRTNGKSLGSLSDDIFSSIVNSSIGPAHHAGIPGTDIIPDVDVYKLNGGELIKPNTRIRITVRLTDLGTDLGSRTPVTFEDFSGTVQFGIFDTTNATNVTDGLLVYAPSDFAPIGGTPGTIAQNGANKYGYDANGDFFVEFATPGRLGSDSQVSARYDLYLQGAFNGDYQLEIVSNGSVSAPVNQTQNVYLEFGGGTVDWLEAGGRTTSLGAFSAASLGFSGLINGKPADKFVKDRLVADLQKVFDAAGVNVKISTNVADFEFQDFSTVFISSSNDPVHFFNEFNFGASEHSDAMNMDPNDEAVVFAPSFATIGFTPSQADSETFISSLVAATGRRVGELMGLRANGSDFSLVPGDIMAANSVTNQDDQYEFVSALRPLSNGFDLFRGTDFYLGSQNAQSLLDRYFADK